MIQQLRVMKLYSHTKKKQKLFQQILLKKKKSVRRNFYILLAFLLTAIALFIAVIDLLEFDKILSKTNTFITIS